MYMVPTLWLSLISTSVFEDERIFSMDRDSVIQHGVVQHLFKTYDNQRIALSICLNPRKKPDQSNNATTARKTKVVAFRNDPFHRS